jgi:hypothetical protein
MYGTLAGALSGRKIPFDRKAYTVEATLHLPDKVVTISSDNSE